MSCLATALSDALSVVEMATNAAANHNYDGSKTGIRQDNANITLITVYLKATQHNYLIIIKVNES